MTRRLHLFNNSNDLALAADAEAYIPPKNVQRMEHDLAALPVWWASEGDAVLLPDEESRLTAERFFAGHSPKIFFTTPAEGYERLCRRTGSLYTPQPWGWSRSAKSRLHRFGVPLSLLPSDDTLGSLRTLSSKRFAVEYIAGLLAAARCDRLVGHRMRYVTSLPATDIFERTVFKSPWSSSGRGVFAADSLDDPSVREKLVGFIKRQGGFVADKCYDKILDFALEYNVTPCGKALFVGYSVFRAADNGYYGGNVVAPQAELLRKITAAGADAATLGRLVEIHKNLIEKYFGGLYSGPFGVDALVAREGGGTVIHPCVEINLRMNIGILAIAVERSFGCSDRLLTPPDKSLFVAKIRGGLLQISSDAKSQ